MALTLDRSRAVRTPAEKTALVQAVRDAPLSEPEPEELEWKGEGDLRERRWQHGIAKFVLGAANRDPARAALVYEGCAYLLMGVSPGGLKGVSPIDPADLHPGVARFTGEDDRSPRWALDFVQLDDKSVLLVSVEAPYNGDPIFSQRRAWESHRDGLIWVRSPGRTAPATSSELARLEQRARRARDQVQLDVRPTTSAGLQRIDLSSESVARWIERERLFLTGDREDEGGLEAGAELHRGAFAGWDEANRITAAAWIRPKRFAILGHGILLSTGTVEPLLPIEAGEVFEPAVPAPLAPSQAGEARTASLTILGPGAE